MTLNISPFFFSGSTAVAGCARASGIMFNPVVAVKNPSNDANRIVKVLFSCLINPLVGNFILIFLWRSLNVQIYLSSEMVMHKKVSLHIYETRLQRKK